MRTQCALLVLVLIVSLIVLPSKTGGAGPAISSSPDVPGQAAAPTPKDAPDSKPQGVLVLLSNQYGLPPHQYFLSGLTQELTRNGVSAGVLYLEHPGLVRNQDAEYPPSPTRLEA